MAKFHKQLMVPGEQITLANETKAGRLTPTIDEDNYYIRFTQVYDDQCIVEVGVVEGSEGNPRLLIATLYDSQDQQLATEAVAGDVDQDYLLIHRDNSYSLAIVRAANGTLTNEAAAAYNRDPNHCPACGSSDIHRSPIQKDAEGIWARIECCACEARWRDVFVFQSISMAPDDWNSPVLNTAAVQHSPVI